MGTPGGPMNAPAGGGAGGPGKAGVGFTVEGGRVGRVGPTGGRGLGVVGLGH